MVGTQYYRGPDEGALMLGNSCPSGISAALTRRALLGDLLLRCATPSKPMTAMQDVHISYTADSAPYCPNFFVSFTIKSKDTDTKHRHLQRRPLCALTSAKLGMNALLHRHPCRQYAASRHVYLSPIISFPITRRRKLSIMCMLDGQRLIFGSQRPSDCLETAPSRCRRQISSKSLIASCLLLRDGQGNV